MSCNDKCKHSETLYSHQNQGWSLTPMGGLLGSYRQNSNISCTKSTNLNVSCLVLQLPLPNPLKWGVKLNEDAVGAVQTGDAPTTCTSERSTILLPQMWLILEVWGYLESLGDNNLEMYVKYMYTCIENTCLTHWGLVTPYGDIELGQHWLR